MSKRIRRHRQPIGQPEEGDPGGYWLPREASGVLLVSADPYLQEEAKRIVAAAGGTLRTAEGVSEAVHGWDSADVVLVGSDVRELPPRRRAPSVLLGKASDGDGLWRMAAALGAERVAVLPDAASWLAEHLTMSGSPDPGGTVMGIVGGCGGAGASTAAIWLAQAAASQGVSTLLIDGDPWGGGLELAVTDEPVPGLRWPDFQESRGSMDPVQFRDSLPVAGGFTYLSWPGTREPVQSPDAGAIAAIMDAARRAFELTFVDLGRSSEGVGRLSWDCDNLLLLTTAHLRSAVASARILDELPPVDTGLLVRGSNASQVQPTFIAESLGIPLVGVVPEVRGVAAGTELGRLLELGRRKDISRLTGSVLELHGAHR
ncbi:secretion/DNA translocation related CpaE-like protein [Paenarthrobacter nicotinovorans]|uniref:septum site-determining protein Ssd n=1 Tax=Paenarthrobacter nicotinovorans TaxID=29320 RepID=UPI0027822730|nr:septum site-determining protein Ssd [Paenarthrobacter nicotinovorans]MDP9936163.1 secretion/DNA translocation related CpaE-like protein [Paenarthrobacter nicotinovorans]